MNLFPGMIRTLTAVAAMAVSLSQDAVAAEAELVIAGKRMTDAVVVVAPEAGLPETKKSDGTMARGLDAKGTRNNEWLAATELVKYIGLMTGAEPKLVNTRAERDAVLQGKAPVIIVGEEALTANPAFAARVRAAAKKHPILRADSIGLLRAGNRVYVAGNHDVSHSYAASALLQKWGCRWYMPTNFGECIPEVPTLTLGALDETYAPPFEVRKYWISWVGSGEGAADFQRRNFMTPGLVVPNGHAVGSYTQELVPKGRSVFNVPIAEESTATHIATKVGPMYEKGTDFSLGMEDGIYESDSPKDKELKALQYDKYFLQPAMTDSFMTLYNNVSRILREKYPQSKARIGFLAYSNITLPPLTVKKAEPHLVAYLAPIDIDPIHGMDNIQSPPRQEYRDMLYGWAKVMEGRLVIYDYDQGMLVWRDIPNPSVQGLAEDFAHYRKAGILGVDTESRNAIGTTFLNLHCRAQLLWNPALNLDDLLKDFYVRFYGPAAEPMAKYWTAIHEAWRTTLVTEHEYFVAPAIYTPELMAEMRRNLEAAEALIGPLRAKKNPTPREQQVLDRMKFTRVSFSITDNYLAMVHAAATEGDYAKAVAFGDKGLAAREDLTAMNETFTTYQRRGKGGNVGGVPEHGAAWWPGEVDQYRNLQQYFGGKNGTLIQRLPLEWAFHRDPKDEGLEQGWGLEAPDLTYWRDKGATYTLDSRKDYPVTEWEMVKTDLYLQAQGIRMPDRQSYSGHGWYATEIELKPDQVKGPVKWMFPGLFNECWLYINGKEVAHRDTYKPMWWINDYRFEWDVDVTGRLQPGKNLVALRIHNPHHFGGMFRRPFLYAPAAQ